MSYNERTFIWVDPETNVQYDDQSLLPDRMKGTHHHFEFGPLVQWAGGDIPVGPDVLVRCLFRGRRPYIGRARYEGHSDTAASNMWKHAPAPGRSDPNADIVAYQVSVI
jgi:hypothetical protein